MYAVLCSCCGKGVTCFKINKSNMRWDSLVIAIDYKINILDYFDYIKLCLILSNFLQLNPDIFRTKAGFPLLTSESSLGWRNNYMYEF